MENKWRDAKIRNTRNRYVLVTGCDSGLGNAIAKHLDRLGVNVFASCLTKEGEENLKATCSSRLVTLRLDVTNKESISKAFHFVKEHLPTEKDLWGIVNNAGLQTLHAPIELHSDSHFEKTMAVNLFGTVYVTREFLPLLRRSRGRVVNISSDAGLMTWPARSAYCMSKYGVESFTDCIRREMYYVGINASTVIPGAFKTSIVSPAGMTAQLEDACSRVSEEVRDFYGEGFYEEYICPDTGSQKPDPGNAGKSVVASSPINIFAVIAFFAFLQQ
ncbi:hypothetical protein FSP39_025079 [Pinctada imbricata]|uniref:Uncharacterized protein n=1 Tax=Pinctada imbricata TaxID=66713 RepID=A0AA88YUL1_PINIB|nr:hypothetical protein FSP39_025079 [Pinctada imbricata]